MEISLIRHGKSKWIDNKQINCEGFQDWVEKYDYSGVFEESFYPSETLDKIATASIVITSDLNRSIESAQLLNPNVQAISDPLFRETDLPIPLKKFWGIKLNPSLWAVILRCLWFCGYSSKCESLSKAKQRAKKASERLVKYSNENKSVVLIGHGFFNLLIAKELQQMGWKGKRKTGRKHWNCTTYSLSISEED